MNPKISAFIATSLDGYIARTDGDLDWLDAANTTVPSGEDCGFSQFFESIDALVMGRNTFEKVLSFGAWPYGNKPVIILSRNPIDFPSTIPPTVVHSAESPEQLSQRMFTAGHRHIYIDGGNTIQRFLAAGLVDEITITLIPTLIGDGIPLFGNGSSDVELRHLETKSYDFGFVQIKYGVHSD